MADFFDNFLTETDRMIRDSATKFATEESGAAPWLRSWPSKA